MRLPYRTPYLAPNTYCRGCARRIVAEDDRVADVRKMHAGRWLRVVHTRINFLCRTKSVVNNRLGLSSPLYTVFSTLFSLARTVGGGGADPGGITTFGRAVAAPLCWGASPARRQSAVATSSRFESQQRQLDD